MEHAAHKTQYDSKKWHVSHWKEWICVTLCEYLGMAGAKFAPAIPRWWNTTVMYRGGLVYAELRVSVTGIRWLVSSETVDTCIRSTYQVNPLKEVPLKQDPLTTKCYRLTFGWWQEHRKHEFLKVTSECKGFTNWRNKHKGHDFLIIYTAYCNYSC